MFSASSYNYCIYEEDTDLEEILGRTTARVMTSARITVVITPEIMYTVRRRRPQQRAGGSEASREMYLELHWGNGF